MSSNSLHKFLHQQWKEGDPTPLQEKSNLYNCLTIHWESGEEMTFYYPFLTSSKLYLSKEYNSIVLHFTSDKVTLKGFGLKPLKKLFAETKPSDIYVYNPRYIQNRITPTPVVFEAIVEERRGK